MTYTEKVSYDTIGVIGTPVTLTAAYTGNTHTLAAEKLGNLHIDFQYTPKTGQTDRIVSILVEYSNDNGTTFFPLSLVQNTTTDKLIYTDDAGGNNGLPAIIPGDKTSTGGVTLSGIIDTTITADHIKISVKEDGSANFGTFYARATLTT